MTELDAFAEFAEARACAREAWQVALDRVELDVIRAEQALAEEGPILAGDQWQPPDDYGPIPAELRDRALELLGRQRDCLTQLSSRRESTLRQQALLDRLVEATGRPGYQAVYVDALA